MLSLHIPLCFYAEILISSGLKSATAPKKGIFTGTATGSIIPPAHRHTLDTAIAVPDAFAAYTVRYKQTKEYLNQTKKGLVGRKFASYYYLFLKSIKSAAQQRRVVSNEPPKAPHSGLILTIEH